MTSGLAGAGARPRRPDPSWACGGWQIQTPRPSPPARHGSVREKPSPQRSPSPFARFSISVPTPPIGPSARRRVQVDWRKQGKLHLLQTTRRDEYNKTTSQQTTETRTIVSAEPGAPPSTNGRFLPAKAPPPPLPNCTLPHTCARPAHLHLGSKYDLQHLHDPCSASQQMRQPSQQPPPWLSASLAFTVGRGGSVCSAGTAVEVVPTVVLDGGFSCTVPFATKCEDDCGEG